MIIQNKVILFSPSKEVWEMIDRYCLDHGLNMSNPHDRDLAINALIHEALRGSSPAKAQG